MEKLKYLDWSSKRPATGKAAEGKHLMFELRGWAFALPSLSSSGIVRKEGVGHLHEMPGMEPPLSGMVNYMGNALPIFDFAWNWESEAKGEALILLGHAPKQLGFWVDGLPKNTRMTEKYDRVGIDSLQIPEGVRRVAAGMWHLRKREAGASVHELVVELASYEELAERFKLN